MKYIITLDFFPRSLYAIAWIALITCIPALNGQSPISLRKAGNFAVLAGATVTNTGNTIVDGDVGAGPGTDIPGFPPGIIHGSLHAGDSVSAAAQSDLTTAYIEAVTHSVNPITIDGNLGGQTLAPGTYKSTSSIAISSGDLTLDAGGDANAVYIFQIASALTTTSGRQVILTGGANAANIFWQVGSSVTLGTTSVFKGIILAQESITLETGASLEGKALARIGGITLDANTITGVVSGGLWSGAVDLGNGHRYLQWLGNFSEGDETWGDWIWHENHGWLHPSGISQSDIWFWSPDMGFLWTSNSVYPFMYRTEDSTWIWYEKGSNNPRWFYSFKASTWEAW